MLNDFGPSDDVLLENTDRHSQRSPDLFDARLCNYDTGRRRLSASRVCTFDESRFADSNAMHREIVRGKFDSARRGDR
jgi:hypothetical protein